MLSRRHELPALVEPEYEVEDVPRANFEGEGSASQLISDRNEWLRILPEMVLVSSQAEENYEMKLRREGKTALHPGKPLSLDYLADRVDTDDPCW